MFTCKFIDKIGMPLVVTYICRRSMDYDLSMVEWIKLLPLRQKTILSGLCEYPVASDESPERYVQGYRLRASVNIFSAPPLTYCHWGRVPAPDSRAGWRSGETTYVFEDTEDAAVHTLAHEVFHFLAHSRQIDQRNTEANANWFADRWLTDWQRWSAR